MFVASVCTQPPYNDKDPPSVFFLISLNHFPFLISSHSQMLVCVTSHRPRPLPRLFIDTSVLPQTRPKWAVISPPLFRRWSRCRQEWLLSVGCNNEHSSHHLIPTSDPLKTQWITFVCEGNASPDLPICIYVRANHSWSSLIYRRSEYKFLLWIFANRLS